MFAGFLKTRVGHVDVMRPFHDVAQALLSGAIKHQTKPGPTACAFRSVSCQAESPGFHI